MLAARRRRYAVAPPPPAEAQTPAAGLERWRKRSSRIRWARALAPWGIALLVLSVAGWLVGRAVIQAMRPTTAGQQIRMSRPRFIGRDDHGKPYALEADEAVRDPATPDLIHLTRPHMVLDVGKPAPATLAGEVGAFNEASRILAVTGNAVFTDGSGYTFRSERAKIDTWTFEVQGEAAVSGEGPLGTTRATAYAVHDRGERVVFTGDVHTHLYNGTQPPRPKVDGKP